MISKREIDEIRRQMRGLTYYSVQTDILSELLETYEEAHPEARGLKLVEKLGKEQKSEGEGE